MAEIRRRSATVPITSVRPYPNNPRLHKDDLLDESIRDHGQYAPVLVQESTSYIIKGNGTYAALMRARKTEIDVWYLDVDDSKAEAILLIDNKSSDDSQYEEGLLYQILSERDDLTGTGFTADEVQALLDKIDEPFEPLDVPDLCYACDAPVDSKGKYRGRKKKGPGKGV